MGRLMQQSRLPVYISVAAILTVVAGALLYYKDFGFKLAVIMTPVGLGFTTGATFAILGLIVGGAVTGPVSAQLGKLGGEIQAGGKPPTPEQAADLQKLQVRMSDAAKWTAVLTGLALLFMAIARYL